MTAGVPDGFETLAREALAEVTPPDSVGELLSGEQAVEDVVDLAFASRLPGYVGWRWSVSMAQLPDAGPSVLEVELLPGEGALLVPPWVPWAERLAEYRRTHPDAEAVETDEDEEELDEDDLDADEDVLDDEADDVLDGVDFEANGDGDDEASLVEDDDLDEDDGALTEDDEVLEEDDDVLAEDDDEDPEEHRPEA